MREILGPYETGLPPGVGTGEESLEHGAAQAGFADETQGLLRLVGDQGVRQCQTQAARHAPLAVAVVCAT
ncbi:hypothetical protein [Streptomyces collinus]|uniref:hypothetical protein n=1 Tax=Streptomyces collinus TaxID=42684 RepID=UPI0034086A8E